MCGITVFIGNVVLPIIKYQHAVLLDCTSQTFKYFHYCRHRCPQKHITHRTTTMSNKWPCVPLIRSEEDGTEPHPTAKGSTGVRTSHALAHDPSVFPLPSPAVGRGYRANREQGAITCLYAPGGLLFSLSVCGHSSWATEKPVGRTEDLTSLST